MVNRQKQRSYGVDQPFIEKSPEPIRAQRDPRNDDFAEIGTIWINEVNKSSFILTQIAANNATWYGTANAVQRVNNGVQVLSGDGDPTGTVVAPVGSIYLNIDPAAPDDRMYINTDGGAGWADVTFNS